MADSEPTSDRRWDDFKHLSDLFRFYLELIFKAFTFALGVSGGVVAFVLGKDVYDRRIATLGVLLPSVLCIGMGVAFLCGIPSAKELTSALNRLKTALGLELAPHGRNLSMCLLWFGILLVLVGVALFLFPIFWRPTTNEAPNHALQRTAPHVRATASSLPLSLTMQPPRRASQSLSLGSLDP